MTEHDLVACARCARHAFVREGRCPFCGAALPEPPPPDRPRWLGPVTRAAIFYGASALASIGCSEPAPPPPGPDPKTAAPHEAPAAAVEPSAAVLDDALPALSPEPIAIEEDDEATRARERAHAEAGKSRLRAQVVQQQNQRIQQQQLQHQRHILQMPPYGAPAFDFVV